MLEILRKGYLVTLGLASLTREKVEEVVDELVRRGEIAENDRPHVVEDLLSRMKEEQKRLSSSIKETVQKVISDMGLPSRRQYEDLLQRIEKMEKAAKAGESSPEAEAAPQAANHGPTA